MVENNVITPVMTILERVKVRVDESKKNTELMATTLQTRIKDTQKKMLRNLTIKKGKVLGQEKQMAREERKKETRISHKSIHH